jgi:hypothetical protein
MGRINIDRVEFSQWPYGFQASLFVALEVPSNFKTRFNNNLN